MNLTWIKCQGNGWCSLERVNLEGIGNTAGVYVIWHGGQTPRYVRIGQGNIKERLSAHRNDKQIMAYRSHGDLFVTWAAVPAHQHDGVEAFLAQACSPIVGDKFPDRQPISVNLPK